MTTTTNLYPVDVPLPARAECEDAWQDSDPQPYRVVYRPDRGIKRPQREVFAIAVQYADGSLNREDDPPTVHVSDICWEEGPC